MKLYKDTCMMPGCRKRVFARKLCGPHDRLWMKIVRISRKPVGPPDAEGINEIKIFSNRQMRNILNTLENVSVLHRRGLTHWLIKLHPNITKQDKTNDFSMFKPRYENEGGEENEEEDD